jgi:hypothetical protein
LSEYEDSGLIGAPEAEVEQSGPRIGDRAKELMPLIRIDCVSVNWP